MLGESFFFVISLEVHIVDFFSYVIYQGEFLRALKTEILFANRLLFSNRIPFATLRKISSLNSMHAVFYPPQNKKQTLDKNYIEMI